MNNCNCEEYIDEGDLRLKEMSGHVKSENKLDCFLYLLMRDYLKSGDVASIIKMFENGDLDTTFEFTNGFLTNYVIYVRKVLLDEFEKKVD